MRCAQRGRRWRLNVQRRTFAIVLLCLGCRSSPRPASPPTGQQAQALPERSPMQVSAGALPFDEILPETAAPFSAPAPIQFGAGFFCRAYVSGAERVEITIAYFGQEPGAFERWVAGSMNYPQAALALPAAQANGFFSCASELADAPCDLHIQLRSGFHIEVMGNGRVPRRDLSQLMTHVQLGSLSDSTLAAL